MLGHKTKAEVITGANPIANALLGIFALYPAATFASLAPERDGQPDLAQLCTWCFSEE